MSVLAISISATEGSGVLRIANHGVGYAGRPKVDRRANSFLDPRDSPQLIFPAVCWSDRGTCPLCIHPGGCLSSCLYCGGGYSEWAAGHELSNELQSDNLYGVAPRQLLYMMLVVPLTVSILHPRPGRRKHQNTIPSLGSLIAGSTGLIANGRLTFRVTKQPCSPVTLASNQPV